MKRQHQNALAFAAVIALLAACASVNPFAYAKTTLDKAHVALSSLEIAQTEVLTLVTDPAMSANVKTALKAASRNATLAATELGAAVVEVEQARAELIAGGSNNEKLAIANAKLLQWTSTVLARIKSIESALKEAKRHD